jgi:hypothetical protein
MRRYLPAFNSLPSSLQRLRVIGIWWPRVLISNPLAFFSDRLSDSYSLFTRSAHLLSVPLHSGAITC